MTLNRRTVLAFAVALAACPLTAEASKSASRLMGTALAGDSTAAVESGMVGRLVARELRRAAPELSRYLRLPERTGLPRQRGGDARG